MRRVLPCKSSMQHRLSLLIVSIGRQFPYLGSIYAMCMFTALVVSYQAPVSCPSSPIVFQYDVTLRMTYVPTETHDNVPLRTDVAAPPRAAPPGSSRVSSAPPITAFSAQNTLANREASLQRMRERNGPNTGVSRGRRGVTRARGSVGRDNQRGSGRGRITRRDAARGNSVQGVVGGPQRSREESSFKVFVAVVFPFQVLFSFLQITLSSVS